MNHSSLGEFVNHRGHRRQLAARLVLILDGADVSQGIAHGLGIVTILQSLFLVCSDSFDG